MLLICGCDNSANFADFSASSPGVSSWQRIANLDEGGGSSARVCIFVGYLDSDVDLTTVISFSSTSPGNPAHFSAAIFEISGLDPLSNWLIQSVVARNAFSPLIATLVNPVRGQDSQLIVIGSTGGSNTFAAQSPSRGWMTTQVFNPSNIVSFGCNWRRSAAPDIYLGNASAGEFAVILLEVDGAAVAPIHWEHGLLDQGQLPWTESIGSRHSAARPAPGGGKGEDIWLDLARTSGDGHDRVVTPGGDWKLTSGDEALRQSLIRRLLTDPGEWVTVPDYGVGARRFVKAKLTQSSRDELKSRIRAQFLRDPRVEKISQVVIEGTEGMLRILVSVQSRLRAEQAASLVVAVELT
jgi:phage baseplate assembly protein W